MKYDTPPGSDIRGTKESSLTPKDTPPTATYTM